MTDGPSSTNIIQCRPWISVIVPPFAQAAHSKILEEDLEEYGFTTCECTQVGELSAVLDGQPPDLTIAGLLPMTP